jgi:tetratricopeptide (TPR) repeat protein
MVRHGNMPQGYIAIQALHDPPHRQGLRKAIPSFIGDLVALLAAMVLCSACIQQAATAWAAPGTSAGQPPATDSDPRSPAAMNKSEEAQSYKRQGDRYVSEDAIQLAANAYQRALLLSRNQFTWDERVQMAVYISWDNRLESAIRELQLVLAEDPGYLDARVNLARIYGWSGDMKRSIAEADVVLRDQPDYKDALLIKANALEWQGKYGEAISIYEKIIERDGDFDAQVGLSSSLLYKGDRAGAARQAKLLTADDPRQQRKLYSLLESIDSETRPRIDLRYNRYADCDHNLSDRYTARFNVPIGNQEIDIGLGHTESRGIGPRAQADDFAFQARFNHAGSVGFGGSAGLSRLRAGNTALYPIGHVRIEGRLPHTMLAITMGSSMLNETSELIENHIRRTIAGFEVLQQFHDRFSLSGAYNRMRFSDGNDANDIQAQSEYKITLAPRLAFGYRGRFLDFERNTRSGYFDPADYISHRIYSGFYLKQPRFFIDLEVYYGKQDFKRYGERTDDWIAGGAGSVGIMPVRGLVLEVNASGGDFAAGSVSGFRYFTIGSLVSYRF